MKIASLIAALVATAALTAFAQEGVVQDVKHGAKKAGETIKDGVETVGEKTKETAKTVGKKTKEAAETVGEKTKETGETVVRKTKQTVMAQAKMHPRLLIKRTTSPGRAPAQRRPKPRKNRRQIVTQIRRRPDSESAIIVVTTLSNISGFGRCLADQQEIERLGFVDFIRCVVASLCSEWHRRKILFVPTCSHSSSESYLAR